MVSSKLPPLHSELIMYATPISNFPALVHELEYKPLTHPEAWFVECKPGPTLRQWLQGHGLHIRYKTLEQAQYQLKVWQLNPVFVLISPEMVAQDWRIRAVHPIVFETNCLQTNHFAASVIFQIAETDGQTPIFLRKWVAACLRVECLSWDESKREAFLQAIDFMDIWSITQWLELNKRELAGEIVYQAIQAKLFSFIFELQEALENPRIFY